MSVKVTILARIEDAEPLELGWAEAPDMDAMVETLELVLEEIRETIRENWEATR